MFIALCIEMLFFTNYFVFGLPATDRFNRSTHKDSINITSITFVMDKEQHNMVNLSATYLLILAGEMPNSPAHVLEAGAALASVSTGNNLDPCSVDISLIDTRHNLLNKVLGQVKLCLLPQICCRLLLFLDRRCAAIKNRLQVPIDPFISSHSLVAANADS